MNTWTATSSGLPDPHYQAEFYADVTMKRAIAWVIDAVVIGTLVALSVVLTAFIGIFFLGFLTFAISFLYRSITIATFSATPGMMLTAIELRTHRGERFDAVTAMLHTLGFLLSMSFVVVQLVSIVLMFTTPRGQGLNDMILGTAAVNRRARA